MEDSELRTCFVVTGDLILGGGRGGLINIYI